MKILNIRDIHGRARPTPESLGSAELKAQRLGILLGSDGRAYAAYQPANPMLPGNVRGRWEKGRVVPRHG